MQWREVQLQPGSTGTMQRPVLWSKGHLTLWRPVGDQYFSRLWKCTRLLQWRSLLQSQRWRHSWACGRGSVGNSCVGSWTTLLQLFMSMTTIKEMCERQNSFIRSHKSFGSRFIPCKWSYYFLFPFSQLSFQINLTASPPLALECNSLTKMALTQGTSIQKWKGVNEAWRLNRLPTIYCLHEREPFPCWCILFLRTN